MGDSSRSSYRDYRDGDSISYENNSADSSFYSVEDSRSTDYISEEDTEDTHSTAPNPPRTREVRVALFFVVVLIVLTGWVVAYTNEYFGLFSQAVENKTPMPSVSSEPTARAEQMPSASPVLVSNSETPSFSQEPSLFPNTTAPSSITEQPSSTPSALPSSITEQPSSSPSSVPSSVPSNPPSSVPSSVPSSKPPTLVPSEEPSLSPTVTALPSISTTPTECVNDIEWKDATGDSCAEYEKYFNHRCDKYGDAFKDKENKTANMACCVCGGGTINETSNECVNDIGWKSGYFDCPHYEATRTDYWWCGEFGRRPELANEGKTADMACCVCGGGSHLSALPSISPAPSSITISPQPTPEECEDEDADDWADYAGADCSEYNSKLSGDHKLCKMFGHIIGDRGKSANMACCICGGGKHIPFPT